jgi:hypothetical protein
VVHIKGHKNKLSFSQYGGNVSNNKIMTEKKNSKLKEKNPSHPRRKRQERKKGTHSA